MTNSEILYLSPRQYNHYTKSLRIIGRCTIHGATFSRGWDTLQGNPPDTVILVCAATSKDIMTKVKAIAPDYPVPGCNVYSLVLQATNEVHPRDIISDEHLNLVSRGAS